MQNTLVIYRTNDYRYRKYAIVPTIWLSDLLGWLHENDTTEVIGTTPTSYKLRVPECWPNYRACLDYARVADLIKEH